MSFICYFLATCPFLVGYYCFSVIMLHLFSLVVCVQLSSAVLCPGLSAFSVQLPFSESFLTFLLVSAVNV